MIALLLFQLATLPVQGVWRFEPNPNQAGAVHMAVEADGKVRLYDVDWSLFDIHELKIDSGKLYLRFANQAKTKYRVLDGVFEEDRLEGTIEMPVGGAQFKIKQPFKAIRVLDSPPPFSVDWIVGRRKGRDSINLVSLVVEQAPRTSFDDFLKFWTEKVEADYYPYLHSALYGPTNDPERRLKRLRGLFERLDRYAEIVDSLESRADLRISELHKKKARVVAHEASFRVIVPEFEGESVQAMEVPIEKIHFKKGQAPCCGARGYKFEWCLVIPLGPHSDPKKERAAGEQSRRP